MKLSKPEKRLIEDLDNFLDVEKKNEKTVKNITLYTDQMKVVESLLKKSTCYGYEELRTKLYISSHEVVYCGMKL